MSSPKLSFYFHSTIPPRDRVRVRTRRKLSLGSLHRSGDLMVRVTSLGWEGDRFAVTVHFAETR